jgi:hypothetical protein
VCPPPLMHLLRLGQLALGPVQDPQKVDGVEGGLVVRSQRLLVPGQRPYVHLLRLGQLALVPIQDPEIVDVLRARCFIKLGLNNRTCHHDVLVWSVTRLRIWRWVLREFERQRLEIKNALATSHSRIHDSFDLWTPDTSRVRFLNIWTQLVQNCSNCSVVGAGIVPYEEP